ncbi:hypothetical protein KIN20_016481 [Parelaphostrongylus tenuis]|uniref:Uncharacterized protein n=1 Tax=Parelaphostrongylus tenuis TaxID=148309 RepID=A0AAD5N5B8_PARTN|nr:hypothetical protein KIN20_016481 [Parelaphostrongylus tenuis]
MRKNRLMTPLGGCIFEAHLTAHTGLSAMPSKQIHSFLYEEIRSKIISETTIPKNGSDGGHMIANMKLETKFK